MWRNVDGEPYPVNYRVDLHAQPDSFRDPLPVLGNTVYNAVSHVLPTGERVLSTVILSLPGNSRGVCRGAETRRLGIGNCMKQVKGLFDGRV